jgi:beta-glucosidase
MNQSVTIKHVRGGCLRLGVITAAASAMLSSSPGQPAPDVSQQVEALLRQMTLEEKAGQMCQFVGFEHLKESLKRRGKAASNDDSTGMYPGLRFRDLEQMVRDGRIGSFLHVVTMEEAVRLQSLAMESRLKIPLVIGIDAIHGNGMVRGTTIYPSPLGLAATFDEALVERLSVESAREIRANGAQWAFTPNVDVARDARWGRVGETFGEDPLLAGRMGAAMVRGLQGKDLNGPDHVLACVKHAIGGGQPINGLNAAPSDISEHTLRGVFLPPFLDCINEGVGSLMIAHNELNGVPCHANRWLVEEVLRGEGGFDGFVVSDWMDIERLVTLHRIVPNQKEAVYRAVMAGVDMHMHGPGFLEPLIELVNEGRIPESRIDASARRILRAKFKLGLFEPWKAAPEQAANATFTAAHQQTALDAARKSIVLLKNDASLLPLDAARFKRVLVTGPLADSHAILGDWVLPQPEENVITPLEGLKQTAPAGCEITYFNCGESVKATPSRTIAEAARRAAEADLTILVVGDNALRYDDAGRTSGENTDRSDIELPGDQPALVNAVAAAGRPVVVVLVNSRPTASERTLERVPAVVEAFEPGCKGGLALAEILFGRVNPSGRLPISIPRSAGHIQTFYNHKPSQFYHTYVIGSSEPLFSFGHGLSYTAFKYENLRVPPVVASGQPVEVTVDVQNTGSRSGDEVVLVYVNDRVSSTTTPVRALKAFKRVSLQPGVKQTVHLSIAWNQLSLIDEGMKRVVEPGQFEVFVGNQRALFEVRP